MWEDLLAGLPSQAVGDVAEMPTGLDFMSNFDWGSLPSGPSWPENFRFDPESGWPGAKWGQDYSDWEKNYPSAPGSSFNWGKMDNWMNNLGKSGVILKNFADPAFGIMKMKAMSDYQNDYRKYLDAQNAYAKQKQAYETDFMNRFAKSQEEFQGANAEFQGKLEEASGAANEVMQQFLGAAKPLLAQSQEMLVPAVAALAKGEVPEQWAPILEQAKQRAMAAGTQAMVSAGMSPEEARASLGPKIDQDAHQMLLQLGTTLMAQGLATGAQGSQNLQGAGQLTQILGQLAAAGLNPAMQEFQAMAAVLSRILGGGTSLTPPHAPVA